MLSLGIVWNSAYNYRNEIVTDMKKHVKVIECFDIKLKNFLQDFIYELYEGEEKWKIDKKYNIIKQDYNLDSYIEIIIFEFNDAKVRFHPYKKKEVYSELDDLKVFIRNKYGAKIDNYVFDNVFHSTDDLCETKKSYEIVEKYIKKLLIQNLKLVLAKQKGELNVKR